MATKNRTLICRECGNTAEAVQEFGRPRVYCGVECARTANQRKSAPGFNNKERTCKRCGIKFRRTKIGQPTKYCSLSCRYGGKPESLWLDTSERICRHCSGTFKRAEKGQPTKYCSTACKKAGKLKSMRDRNSRRAAKKMAAVEYCCVHCGTSFHKSREWRGIKYCSIACAVACNAYGRKIPDGFRKPIRTRNPNSYFNCPNCGKQCYRKVWKGRLGYDDPKSSMWNRYCSAECRQSYKTAEASRRIAARAERKALKMLINKEVDALRRIARRPNRNRRICKRCGGLFLQPKRIGKCCKACAQSAHRAMKLRGKSIRRARLKIAADKIDPIKVFELGDWRCHMCRRKTPKHLRGTYEDLAPELDHIITLADGGSHTWDNVACSCRQCNIRKGSKSFGQLRIAA